jgi:thymidylate kinase
MLKTPSVLIEFEKRFQIKRLSDIQTWFSASDIDYLVKPNDVSSIVKFFVNQDAVVVHTAESLGVYLYSTGELYFLDFNICADGLVKRFGRLKFKNNFYNDIWQDPLLHKFFKYVLNIRTEAKYTTFVEDNFDIYAHYLSDTTYFTRPIFKKKITKQDTLQFMRKRPFTFFRILTPMSFSYFCLTYVTQRFVRFNRGKIVAFVEVDGAGKTTVIKEMQRFFGAKVVYMGDYDFVFQHFYHWVGGKHLHLARLCFCLQVFEQWGRYLKIRWYTFRGIHVLTDRYPRFNRPLRKEGALLKLNTLLYSWFPQPHGYIFLYADPKVIHARKQEMSIKHIETYQKNAFSILHSKNNALCIENVDLNHTYTEVLRFCFFLHNKNVSK